MPEVWLFGIGLVVSAVVGWGIVLIGKVEEDREAVEAANRSPAKPLDLSRRAA